MIDYDFTKDLELSNDEIKILDRIMYSISHIADLVNSDIFIDCFDKKFEKCYVIAEAKPSKNSIYEGSVIGEIATEEKEPAVFMVLKTGMTAKNIRAITQENKIVRQDVVPIKNSKGTVFAVLIREKDVSENIQAEKKYQDLAYKSEIFNELLMQCNGGVTPYTPSISKDAIAMKEIHHRVKNNLQFVASLLNIQSRKIDDLEVKQAFKENISRILSIASVYDILTQDGGLEDRVSLKGMIENLINITINYADIIETYVDINIEGKDILLSSSKATSIAIIVNELLTNIYKHAFIGRSQGNVNISIFPDIIYSTILITDDGIGFDVEKVDRKSFGLELVRLTLIDKLEGNLQISSSEYGSKLKIDFKN